MASASAPRSPRGTSRPVAAALVTKRGPPPRASVVITGQPTLMASVRTCAKPSSSEGSTNAHARAAYCKRVVDPADRLGVSLKPEPPDPVVGVRAARPVADDQQAGAPLLRTSAKASTSRSRRFQYVMFEVLTNTGG